MHLFSTYNFTCTGISIVEEKTLLSMAQNSPHSTSYIPMVNSCHYKSVYYTYTCMQSARLYWTHVKLLSTMALHAAYPTECQFVSSKRTEVVDSDVSLQGPE